MTYCNMLILKHLKWCRWSDSNRHDFLRSQDFKSCASAISPHRLPFIYKRSVIFEHGDIDVVLVFVLESWDESQCNDKH